MDNSVSVIESIIITLFFGIVLPCNSILLEWVSSFVPQYLFLWFGLGSWSFLFPFISYRNGARFVESGIVFFIL